MIAQEVDTIVTNFLTELQQKYQNNELRIRDCVSCGPLSGVVSHIEIVTDFVEPRRDILGNFGEIIIDFGIVEVTIYLHNNKDLQATDKCEILEFCILLLKNKMMEICIRGIGDITDITSSTSHLTSNSVAERHMLVFRCGGTKLRKIDLFLFVDKLYQSALKQGILEKDLIASIIDNCKNDHLTKITKRIVLFTEDYAVIFDIDLITVVTKTNTVNILALCGKWVHSQWLSICPANEVVTSQHISEI